MSASPDEVRRLAGTDVRVRVQGDGPPVLLLGGCGVPSALWAPVLERLSGVTVLRLDRAGAGGTPWPGRLPTLDGEVSVLTALLETLEEPAVVVAHSMAGPHAEALTRLRPDLVARLVLVDSTVRWPSPAPRSALSRAAWLALARLARRLVRAGPTQRLAGQVGWLGCAGQTRVRTAAVRHAVRVAFTDPEAVAAVVAEQAVEADQLAALRAVRARSPWPGTPVVVLVAAGDGAPGWVADQRRLARLLSAGCVVVEDARHLMMLDCPDVLTAAVARGHRRDERR